MGRGLAPRICQERKVGRARRRVDSRATDYSARAAQLSNAPAYPRSVVRAAIARSKEIAASGEAARASLAATPGGSDVALGRPGTRVSATRQLGRHRDREDDSKNNNSDNGSESDFSLVRRFVAKAVIGCAPCRGLWDGPAQLGPRSGLRQWRDELSCGRRGAGKASPLWQPGAGKEYINEKKK